MEQEAQQHGGGGGSAISDPDPAHARSPPQQEAPTAKKARLDVGSGKQEAPTVDHQAAMRAVLENLALTGDDEIDPPEKSLVIALLRHQRMALAWMVKRELGSSPRGGILADDQGLGKTVSTMSLIMTNMPDPATRGVRLPAPQAAAQGAAQKQHSSGTALGVGEQVGTGGNGAELGCDEEEREEEGAGLLQGGTLVVCPTTVLHQWHRELTEKINRQQTNLTVHIYHGKDKTNSAVHLSKCVVVLTTYGTLAMEAPERLRVAPKGRKSSTGGGAAAPPGAPAALAAPLEPGAKQETKPKLETKPELPLKQEVKSDVKPEAQPDVKADLKQEVKPLLKDKASSQGQAGAVLASAPPAVPPSKRGSSSGAGGGGGGGGLLFQIKWFRVVLDEAQSIKNPSTLVARAAGGLVAEHRWCLSGTPIQNTVDDLFSYFRFLRYAPYDQPASFKALIKDHIASSASTGFKLLQVVLQAIMLRRTKASKLDGQPIVALPPREQVLLQPAFTSPKEADFYRQVADESQAAIMAEGADGQGASYAAMLHSLLRLRQACNHPWLVRGTGRAMYGISRPPTVPQLAAARKIPELLRSQLLAALAGGAPQCQSCGDEAELPLVTRCGHVYCTDCLATHLEGGGSDAGDSLTCLACGTLVRGTEAYAQAALEAAAGAKPGSSNAAPAKPMDPKAWVSSTKVDCLLKLLDEVRTRNGSAAPMPGGPPTGGGMRSKANRALARTFRSASPAAPRPGGLGGGVGPLLRDGRRPEKVIVFSQWTAMLDILEVALGVHKHTYRRLDGTMAIPAREQAIADFEQQSDVNVFLVSLKAAALGVNLVAANHVVLLDLWWNPTIEEQAIDRAHRIGQKRTVHVVRVTIKDSIEDRILELQARKRDLVAAALSEGGGGVQASKLSMEDLRFLFNAPTGRGAAGAAGGSTNNGAGGSRGGGVRGAAGSA